MKLRLIAITAAVFLCALPAPARADFFMTPFAGVTFGGNSADGEGAYGTSLTWMGAGVFGFEFDFAYHPDIFNINDSFSPDIKASTVMGNLVVGAPFGGDTGRGVRPYFSGGGGLIRTASARTDLFDEVTSNDFGINMGAGVVGFFSDHVGVRGDVRYFRSLQDVERGTLLDLQVGDFDYWRTTVGATFRF